MNIIVNGFHNRSHFRVIAKLCKDFGIKYAAHVYSQEAYPLPGSVKTDFFKWQEVFYHANYSLDPEKLIPLDEELICAMRNCEAVALDMMSRMERYKNYCYGERKELYLSHLRVWNHIIEQKKIDLLISSNVPHLVHDYIAYELCLLKKIPTIILKQSQVHGSFLIFENWEKLNPEIKTKYSHYLRQKEIKLSENFNRHYLVQTGKGDATPFYMKKTSRVRRLSAWLKSLIEEREWGRRLKFGTGEFLTALKIALKTRLLMRYLEKVSVEPDFNKKYIYLPLHLQPEMTTSPCADAFVDQYLIIDLLSSVLPKGYLIYVKENPKQTSLLRSRRYYDRIIKHQNVRIVSRKTNTYDLIAHCQAVATATGTAGWEALFRGKPVIMFGHNFYQYAPGVCQVESLEDAKAAIDFIKEAKNQPTDKQMKAFLKAFEQTTIPGYVDPHYCQASPLTESQNEVSLAKAIGDYMVKLGFEKHD